LTGSNLILIENVIYMVFRETWKSVTSLSETV